MPKKGIDRTKKRKGLTRVAKEALVVDQRQRGVTYKAIGEQLGITKQAVHALYKAAMARQVADFNPVHFLTLQIERHDLLVEAAMKKAVQGDPVHIALAMKIMEQQNKILMLANPNDPEAPAASPVMEAAAVHVSHVAMKDKQARERMRAKVEAARAERMAEGEVDPEDEAIIDVAPGMPTVELVQ